MTVSIRELISRPGVRVNCDVCGEEIINEREVISCGLTLCRSCAGDSYFQTKDEAAWPSINLAEASITCESR